MENNNKQKNQIDIESNILSNSKKHILDINDNLVEVEDDYAIDCVECCDKEDCNI